MNIKNEKPDINIIYRDMKFVIGRWVPFVMWVLLGLFLSLCLVSVDPSNWLFELLLPLFVCFLGVFGVWAVLRVLFYDEEELIYYKALVAKENPILTETDFLLAKEMASSNEDVKRFFKERQEWPNIIAIDISCFEMAAAKEYLRRLALYTPTNQDRYDVAKNDFYRSLV